MRFTDRRLTSSVLLNVAGASVFAAWLAGDWIAGAAITVLWMIWWFLPVADGPPVLPLALTYTWMQAVLGILYYATTGRIPLAIATTDYRPVVLMSLGCIVALVAGIRIGHDLLSRREIATQAGRALSWRLLIISYAVALASRTALEQFAWATPSLNQGLLALGYLRFAIFYIMLRRLVRAERHVWAGLLIALEIGVGLAGFFAEFREPLFIASIVLIEHFDRRRLLHWQLAGGLVAAALVFGVLWMAIRTDVRQRISENAVGTSISDRLTLVSTLGESWAATDWSDKMQNLDAVVDRLWDVYYPALAAARVPSVLPHENGALLWGALVHVATPRALFPDKAALESDSLLVRKYTGVWVAGPDEGTSIAFGYPIESYIDFGVPLMFVPVFVFGMLAGVGFRWLTTSMTYREVAVASVTVIFWLALAPAERGWARMLGFAGTLYIYIGGAAIVLDRWIRLGNASGSESTETVRSPEYTASHI